ncbi:hypothetical protein M0804_009934 [Polistes exclamans]|nr:hypothetical protein M0804_009934 [Polistes exclamans]
MKYFGTFALRVFRVCICMTKKSVSEFGNDAICARHVKRYLPYLLLVVTTPPKACNLSSIDIDVDSSASDSSSSSSSGGGGGVNNRFMFWDKLYLDPKVNMSKSEVFPVPSAMQTTPVLYYRVDDVHNAKGGGGGGGGGGGLFYSHKENESTKRPFYLYNFVRKGFYDLAFTRYIKPGWECDEGLSYSRQNDPIKPRAVGFSDPTLVHSSSYFLKLTYHRTVYVNCCNI